MHDDHCGFNGSYTNSIDFYSNFPNDKWVNVWGRATKEERQKKTRRRPNLAAKGGNTSKEASSSFSQNYKDSEDPEKRNKQC